MSRTDTAQASRTETRERLVVLKSRLEDVEAALQRRCSSAIPAHMRRQGSARPTRSRLLLQCSSALPRQQDGITKGGGGAGSDRSVAARHVETHAPLCDAAKCAVQVRIPAVEAPQRRGAG